ncbi:hypothetical protein HYX07_03440 [Candidatus Woesearchaeota archaeon]|nr:hypothetical protein [Candidatus Woesearchaeota archaeon]
MDCQQPHNGHVYIWAADPHDAFGRYIKRGVRHVNEAIVIQPLDSCQSERLEQRIRSDRIPFDEARRYGYVAKEAIAERKIRFQPEK